MLSKVFSILSSDSHFVHPMKNHFSNFGRGSPKEHFCKIVLKLTHWPRRRCYLNVFFSIFSSDGRFVQRSGSTMAIW